jgi:integrase
MRYGAGSIEQRGANWRIRYVANGERHSRTIKGSRADALRALRDALASADRGTHVTPDKITVGEWLGEWIELLKRGRGDTHRRKAKVTMRTTERYEQLCRLHITPYLGSVRLQRLSVADVDRWLIDLEKVLTAAGVRLAGVCLQAALAVAVRRDMVPRNVMTLAEKPPREDSTIGKAISPNELATLLAGLQGTPYALPVAVAGLCGLRLSETLGLRWQDVDFAAGTLSVNCSIETTRTVARSLKGPKTERSKRTISVDAKLLAQLAAEREKHLRWVAQVSERAEVDLRLVRLPNGALVFPQPVLKGVVSLTRLRSPNSFSKMAIAKMRKLGFRIRFHDLRTSHASNLLAAGVPPHAVAARLGDSVATMMKNYAKVTPVTDDLTAAALAAISKTVL